MNKLWHLCAFWIYLSATCLVSESSEISIDHHSNDDNFVTENNDDFSSSGSNDLQTMPEVIVKQSHNDFGQDFGPKIVNSPPANTNNNNLTNHFTNFLLSQTKFYFSDKTTRKGLDIQTNLIRDLFKSGKLSTRAYAIFPGTIWCGVGNGAPNDDALGLFRLTDSCCRKHDSCPATIPAGGARFGLRNPGMFTRSHCDCDKQFYQCLKKAGTIISDKIGFTYFNILRPQCFRNEYPIVNCVYGFRNRCVIYIVEESKRRAWQWFDNKEF